MNDRDDFLAWVKSELTEAEIALHNGDASLRRALWSQIEPVTVHGAWKSAVGRREVDELFTYLAESFSACTSYSLDIVAADVVGDMAYTVGYERSSLSIDGVPRGQVLRATQVYRREGGQWRVAHRHGDTVPDPHRVVGH